VWQDVNYAQEETEEVSRSRSRESYGAGADWHTEGVKDRVGQKEEERKTQANNGTVPVRKRLSCRSARRVRALALSQGNCLQ
jgi:hypothetical protein